LIEIEIDTDSHRDTGRERDGDREVTEKKCDIKLGSALAPEGLCSTTLS